MSKIKKAKVSGANPLATQKDPESLLHKDSSDSGELTADTELTHVFHNKVVMQPTCCVMIDYLPARLVRAKARWYICFYQTDPVDMVRHRHRDTFDLNRISDLDLRLEAAKTIIRQINSKLPFGYPHDPSLYSRSVSMPVTEALDYVLEIKSDLRTATIQSYRSTCKLFITFLTKQKLHLLPVGSIDESIAISYSDAIVKSGKAGVTHNTEIAALKIMFNLLIKRKIIFQNPFNVVDRRRESPKERQPIASEDIHTILDYLSENDKTAYLSVLLEFYCMIRPTEQRFMQRRQIALDKSLIRVKPESAKNHKDQTVTIPDEFRETLIQIGINRLAPSDFILGYASSIGSRTPIGKNTTSARYTKHMKQLFAEGKISTRKGNTLYSWKDTGGNHFADSIGDAVKMQNQFRHHSLAETQVYLTQRAPADPVIIKKHNLPSKHNTSGANVDRAHT